MMSLSKIVFGVGCVLLATCQSKQPSQSLTTRPLVKAPVTSTRTASDIAFGTLISIDGLGAVYLKPLLDKNRLPGLEQMALLGAFTHEGRTDPSNTTTLPNHTCMVTGLPVAPPVVGSNAYHGLTYNTDPLPKMTLHNGGRKNAGYTPSIFDVAHDFGKKTCIFSGKSKFIIFDRSYDADHGAVDRVGEDNGRDKLDVVVISDDLEALAKAYEDEMSSDAPCEFAFFHIADPDAVGHRFGWGGEAWQRAVVAADRVVARVLYLMETVPAFVNKSALVVTADHGGHGTNHGNTALEANFTIPFYVAAPGVPAKQDLYTLAKNTRHPSLGHNPPMGEMKQPIRNGDSGNLLLELMGLPPVPGSIMYGMLAKKLR